jgi:hypothetical protein
MGASMMGGIPRPYCNSEVPSEGDRLVGPEADTVCSTCTSGSARPPHASAYKLPLRRAVSTRGSERTSDKYWLEQAGQSTSAFWKQTGPTNVDVDGQVQIPPVEHQYGPNKMTLVASAVKATSFGAAVG